MHRRGQGEIHRRRRGDRRWAADSFCVADGFAGCDGGAADGTGVVAIELDGARGIECGAHWTKRQILRGPVAKALSGKSKGIPLGQTFLAFGLCRGALELMGEDRSERAKSLAERFDERLADLRGEVFEICRSGQETDAGPQLRAACNDLTLRITQSLVTLRKGSALLLDDPAQRFAREAIVFSRVVLPRSGDRLHDRSFEWNIE